MDNLIVTLSSDDYDRSYELHILYLLGFGMPTWYDVDDVTYVGVEINETTINEALPNLIWRKSHGTDQVLHRN